MRPPQRRIPVMRALYEVLIRPRLAGYHVDTTGFFQGGSIGGSLRWMGRIKGSEMKYGAGLLR